MFPAFSTRLSCSFLKSETAFPCVPEKNHRTGYGHTSSKRYISVVHKRKKVFDYQYNQRLFLNLFSSFAVRTGLPYQIIMIDNQHNTFMIVVYGIKEVSFQKKQPSMPTFLFVF